MMLYYVRVGTHFEDIPPQVISPDLEWCRQAQGRSVCKQCSCVDRRFYPMPVDIVLKDVPREDQTSVLVDTTNITIWKKEFVERLSQYQNGFTLGRCFTPDGKIIGDYVTCYLKRCITIRGNRQSRYQLCPACGAIISHVEPGPRYVLEKELDNSRVYQDALCRFYVTEDVVDDFEEPMEDVAFDGVSVRQQPADGQQLPGDP